MKTRERPEELSLSNDRLHDVEGFLIIGVGLNLFGICRLPHLQ